MKIMYGFFKERFLFLVIDKCEFFDVYFNCVKWFFNECRGKSWYVLLKLIFIDKYV